MSEFSKQCIIPRGSFMAACPPPWSAEEDTHMRDIVRQKMSIYNIKPTELSEPITVYYSEGAVLDMKPTEFAKKIYDCRFHQFQELLKANRYYDIKLYKLFKCYYVHGFLIQELSSTHYPWLKKINLIILDYIPNRSHTTSVEGIDIDIKIIPLKREGKIVILNLIICAINKKLAYIGLINNIALEISKLYHSYSTSQYLDLANCNSEIIEKQRKQITGDGEPLLTPAYILDILCGQKPLFIITEEQVFPLAQASNDYMLSLIPPSTQYKCELNGKLYEISILFCNGQIIVSNILCQEKDKNKHPDISDAKFTIQKVGANVIALLYEGQLVYVGFVIDFDLKQNKAAPNIEGAYFSHDRQIMSFGVKNQIIYIRSDLQSIELKDIFPNIISIANYSENRIFKKAYLLYDNLIMNNIEFIVYLHNGIIIILDKRNKHIDYAKIIEKSENRVIIQPLWWYDGSTPASPTLEAIQIPASPTLEAIQIPDSPKPYYDNITIILFIALLFIILFILLS